MNFKDKKVKPERTGWRDLALQLRHREWGWDCPAIDIDCLFLEYDKGRAVAIVEYKHEFAPPQNIEHPSYRALIDLGNRAELPVFLVRYARDFSWWMVTPLNSFAKKWVPQQKKMSEDEWVALLYKIRGYDYQK